MKKQNKIIKAVIVLLIVSIFATLLSSCSSGKTRYDLSSGLLGITDISNTFEYNYIELNERDGTYRLENKSKVNDIITKQTGSYAIDGNNIMTITNNEIPTKDYFLWKGETIQVIGGTIVVSCTIEFYGECKMVFTKK